MNSNIKKPRFCEISDQEANQENSAKRPRMELESATPNHCGGIRCRTLPSTSEACSCRLSNQKNMTHQVSEKLQ
ncbi:hypothetical protein GWI33_001080 [Rhynchophorus ferrugineus]|uniref:Uncharacterized protein n=1 Tax=Rhynchophorus ferrugineus TaxID=354439 RepID=A0A834ILI7_RHYFE|nr:hypothetical protein GWI33_001080 [Rhynchophorus ferrugineus]